MKASIRQRKNENSFAIYDMEVINNEQEPALTKEEADRLIKETSKTYPVQITKVGNNFCSISTCPVDQLSSDCTDYIVTCNGGDHGAIAILYPGIMDHIFNELGDYYIIPSSVHEVTIISRNDVDIKELKATLTYIQTFVLNRFEDCLSDNIYRFTINGLEKIDA